MIVDHADLERPAPASDAAKGRLEWEDALLCLTTGHLSVLKLLTDLPPFIGPATTFLQKRPPEPRDYAAALILMMVIAGVLWVATLVARHSRGTMARLVCWTLWIGAAASALNGFRHIAVAATESMRWRFEGGIEWRAAGYALGACLATSLLWTWTRSRDVRRLMRSGLLTLSMLVPANFIAVGMYWAKPRDAGWVEGKAADHATPLGKSASRRVVFLLLDEWDYRLAFEARPADLDLSAMDSLQLSSLFATNAVPPGKSTLSSVPSLLAGHVFDAAKVTGPNSLTVEKDGTRATFQETSQIFSRLTANGYRVGIAGWYLPYCRLASGQFSECEWWEAAFHGYPKTKSLREALSLDLRRLVESNSRSLLRRPTQLEAMQIAERELLAYAAQLTSDSTKDFVYLHLPTLHGPYFYDRRSNDFSLRGSPESGYWDSLYRSSRILDDLRGHLARSAAAANTVLILTSDHPYRNARKLDGKADPRVPFVAVFPGDLQGLKYDRPLNTETADKAVDALLAGEIESPDDLSRWLERRSGLKE